MAKTISSRAMERARKFTDEYPMFVELVETNSKTLNKFRKEMLAHIDELDAQGKGIDAEEAFAIYAAFVSVLDRYNDNYSTVYHMAEQFQEKMKSVGCNWRSVDEMLDVIEQARENGVEA